MRGRGTGLHALVGAYFMDAVSAADRAAFERHLPDCEQCREDVRGLREATARLASAAAIRPRAGLRDQTLLAATRIRQLPPVLAGQDRERQRSPAGRRRGLSWPGWARLGWPATGGRWTWLARTAVVAAVVLACTAVACTAVVVACTAVVATSPSRISPTMITSGSWRNVERNPSAKV